MSSFAFCSQICSKGATTQVLCERGYTFLPPAEEVQLGSQGRFKTILSIIGRMGTNIVFCEDINIVRRILGRNVYQDIIYELLKSMGLRIGNVILGSDVNYARIPSFCELVCIFREKLRNIANEIVKNKNKIQKSQWWCLQALKNPVIALFKIEARGQNYGIALPLAGIVNANSNVPEVCKPSRGCNYTSLPVFWCKTANILFVGYPFCELNNSNGCNTIYNIICPLAYLLRYLGPAAKNPAALVSRLCNTNWKILNNEFNHNAIAKDAICSDIYEYVVRTSWIVKFTHPHRLVTLQRYVCGNSGLEIEVARGSISLKFYKARLKIGRGRLSNNLFDYYPSVTLFARIHDTYYMSITLPDSIVDQVALMLEKVPPNTLQTLTLSSKAVLLSYAILSPNVIPSLHTIVKTANIIAKRSLSRPQTIELSVSGLRRAAEDMRDRTQDFAKLLMNVANEIHQGNMRDFLRAVVVHTFANSLAGAMLYLLSLNEDSIGTIVFEHPNNYNIIAYENIEGGLAVINTITAKDIIQGLSRQHALWSSIHPKYIPSLKPPNLGSKYNKIYQELDRISLTLRKLGGGSYTIIPTWVARLAFTSEWVSNISKGKVDSLEWNHVVTDVIPAYFDLDMHDADNATLVLEKARQDLDDDVQRLLVSGYALQALLPILAKTLIQC